MKLIVVLIPFFAVLACSSAKNIVCYYESWAIYYPNGGAVQPEDIDPNLCTHINYAFAGINEDGSLHSDDEYADVTQGGFYRVTDLKQKNGNLKVLLSIGGANAPSQWFSEIAANSGKRAAMVGSARWFLETYHFDGVDLDWEVPAGKDRDNFISLLQDFRNDFNRNGWLVSAAVSSSPGEGYNVGRMNELLDYFNVMTYDLYGPWSSYTGQNSALYPASIESQWEKDNLNMQSCINNWLNAGASASKLMAGIPFYGHSFTLQNSGNHGLHAPITGAGRGGDVMQEEGSLSFLEWCEHQDSWDFYWDAEQKMPYCVQGNQWLGFEDEGSVRNKVAFINSKGLGGAMVWAIDQDDVHGRCGSARPLLRAIHDNL